MTSSNTGLLGQGANVAQNATRTVWSPRASRPRIKDKPCKLLDPSAFLENNCAMASGSTANVIAALASFFFPGLGQLIQGRFLAALLIFLVAVFFWILGAALGLLSFGILGFIASFGHIVAAFEAAVWKPKN